ncbi:MAG TPA: hypothetical protein VN666_09180 [Nitrospira sp.]|nr:hypothetical protein [Nitrospira sp.]
MKIRSVTLEKLQPEIFVEVCAGAIHERGRLFPKTGGKRVTHEKVDLYTVKNDTVTREEFFYNGPFL